MTEFDYSSTNRRWQHLRQRALRRDAHRCQESARYGRAVPAEVVHHIWPVEEYPQYAYSLSEQTQLYVNSGIGTSRIPVRFRVPPEISLLLLKAAA